MTLHWRSCRSSFLPQTRGAETVIDRARSGASTPRFDTVQVSWQVVQFSSIREWRRVDARLTQQGSGTWAMIAAALVGRHRHYVAEYALALGGFQLPRRLAAQMSSWR